MPGGIRKDSVRQRKRWYVRRRRFLRWWAEHRGPFHCHWCRCALDKRTVTVDHIVARADGGTDDYANLTPACHTCNVKRSSRVARRNNKYRRDEAKAWRMHAERSA